MQMECMARVINTKKALSNFDAITNFSDKWKSVAIFSVDYLQKNIDNIYAAMRTACATYGPKFIDNLTITKNGQAVWK